MTHTEGGREIVRVVIRGHVQGVGFRHWTRHQAQLHGLAGWVRNRRDRSVEAVFAGPPEAVEIMLKALREGPHGARVEALEEYPAAPDELGPAGGDAFIERETA